MYESLINKVVRDIAQQIIKHEIVNKDELTKALQYDRDQYNKGYADAKTEMQNKIDAAIKEIEQIREVYRTDWYVDAADAMSKAIDILKKHIIL